MEPISTGVWDYWLWGVGGAILLLIVASALFSGSETALTTASRAKLHSRAERGDKGAARALQVTEDKERLIGAILLGNNLVNILATAMATMLFTLLLGEGGVVVATLVMTALVLVFAEVMPKTYAIANAETMACRVAALFKVIVVVFAPVVTLVRMIVRGVFKVFGIGFDPQKSLYAANEEIAGAINLHHQIGSVATDARDRLLGALDLHLRRVADVMTHRRNMEIINGDLPEDEIIARVLASPFTRIPVYRGEPDNIIGIIHSKDLMRWLNDETARLARPGVRDILMPAYFVPETVPLDEQIRQFLKRKTHIALVVDEYGSVQGVIALEDILEEIVGEIVDEHDFEEQTNLMPSDDGTVEVQGDTAIRDLNRLHGFRFPDGDAVTIAGLVINHAEAIPMPGAIFTISDTRIEVLASDGLRIARLRISTAIE